jgi:hypothetical protein
MYPRARLRQRVASGVAAGRRRRQWGRPIRLQVAAVLEERPPSGLGTAPTHGVGSSGVGGAVAASLKPATTRPPAQATVKAGEPTRPHGSAGAGAVAPAQVVEDRYPPLPVEETPVVRR